MKASKIIASLVLTIAMFALPVLGKPDLLLSVQILFLGIGSMWSLITQPSISWISIRRHKKQDYYTTFWIMLAIVVSQSASIIEWAYYQESHLWSWNLLTVLGIGSIVLGSALRYWSIRTLGHFFTASVKTTTSQLLITGGPYRHLRHPSYTGGAIAMLGTSLLLENTYAIWLTLFLIIAVYLFRIKAEEKAMLARFGEKYKVYQQNTWRLVPLIW